jgi:hypothetical protein
MSEHMVLGGDLKKNVFGINSMTEKILFFILPHTNANLYWGSCEMEFEIIKTKQTWAKNVY